MCKNICVNIHRFIPIGAYVFLCTYLDMQISVGIYTCVCMCVCVCVYVHSFILTLIYMLTYLRIYSYICVCVSERVCARGCMPVFILYAYIKDLILFVCCWVLWHTNLCRLFNAKSIFMKIICSIENNSV